MAAVWLHQGGWKKVLAPDPRHREIVGTVPGLPPRWARAATAGLGLAETAVAVWVLTGRGRRLAAATQTALLGAMNGGGLALAGEAIPRPGRMLARNAVFLGCVWAIA